MNNLSQSDTILCGSPNCLNQVLYPRRAMSGAVAVKYVGSILTELVSRSVITRVISYPSNLGKGPMKSSAMSENRSWGTGKGCRSSWNLIAGFITKALRTRGSVFANILAEARPEVSS